MALKELLTDLACKNAVAEGAKIRKLHDGQGLYLWVYEDGRKYWRLRYKIHNKEKSLSLGVYPVIGALWIVPSERMKMRNEHVVPLTRQWWNNHLEASEKGAEVIPLFSKSV